MYQSGRLPPKKTPSITVGAEYHGSMYQSGRLRSKKYRALPWCLNTVVNVTNLKNRYREEPILFLVPNKKNGFGSFSYKFIVPVRVGLTMSYGTEILDP